jgi:hypothetical protein
MCLPMVADVGNSTRKRLIVPDLTSTYMHTYSSSTYLLLLHQLTLCTQGLQRHPRFPMNLHAFQLRTDPGFASLFFVNFLLL